MDRSAASSFGLPEICHRRNPTALQESPLPLQPTGRPLRHDDGDRRDEKGGLGKSRPGRLRSQDGRAPLRTSETNSRCAAAMSAQTTPQDTEEDKFPFIHLPGLVQTRILRHYVPFLTKVTVLSNMPEFAGLLDRDSPCWVRGYDAMFDLLPALSSLTPGCYLKSGENVRVPDHVYYVSMDRENHITFTLCMLLNRDWRYFMPGWTRGRGSCSRKECVDSTDDLRNFINLFLNTYALARHSHLRAYVKDENVFVVDRLQRKVFWRDGRTYDLYESKNSVVIVTPHYLVYIRVNLSDDTVTYVYNDEKHVLRSTPFESVVLCEKTNKVKEFRSVLQIAFTILKDNTILTSVEQHQAHYFTSYVDLWNNRWKIFFFKLKVCPRRHKNADQEN